jgi:hypothetical protein
MEQIEYDLIDAQIDEKCIFPDINVFPLHQKLWTVNEVLGNSFKEDAIVTLKWKKKTSNSIATFKKQLKSRDEILIPALASPFGFYCLDKVGNVIDVTSQPSLPHPESCHSRTKNIFY